MPVNPNALERLLWLRLNRAPGPFLDLFGAGGFRAGTVALELGIFQELSRQPRTPAALAGELDLDERGLEVLFNVLHAHTPAENLALFERVRSALGPEGRIVVLDQFEGSSWFTTVETALGFVALTYLVTLGGQIYPRDDVVTWLREAGFDRGSGTTLRRAPGVGLLEADATATSS